MDVLQSLLHGFETAFTLSNFFAAFLGAVLGIIVGAIPGLGSVTGVALLLPLTFGMNPITGIIMLAGIYYGDMYGGSYSAILINVPGDSPAVTTTLDGYPMARKGLAGKALFTSNISSFIGGTIGIIILTIMGPLLAAIGLAFGPPEMTLLILLALCSVGWLLGESPAKGLIATFIGILLSTIGVTITSGQPRFTFGLDNLLSGISFIPLVIGMFGFSQIMEMMTQSKIIKDDETRLTWKESLLNKIDLKRILPPSIRTGILGTFIGILPGAGATTGSMLSYVFEKRVGKNRKEMGTGVVEGVAASESANNAAAAGAFAPLLSLGIPGSGTTAVLLGGLMMWGLNPGPLLFKSSPDLVWGLISSMYIGNIISLIAALAIIPFLMNVIRIPNSIMIPIIIVICIVGAYSVNNNMFDVWVMLAAGVISFFLKINQFPVAPLMLAFILAPTLERSARQSFTIANGNPSIFFSSGICIVLALMIVFFIISPIVINLFQQIKNRNKSDRDIST